LDRRASQLASYLVRFGVGPDARVGICAVRSVDLVVAVLAVLKAGGAYVPLDPEDPPDRLRLMIEESGARIVLTTARHEQRLPPGLSLVLLDADAAAIAGESAADPGVRSGGEALAYVLHTSGSTGRPRGVAVPQRAVVRLVRETDYVHFGADEVFLQLAPLAFDASTFEIWGALLHGATLVLYPPEPPSLPRLRTMLAEHGVTTLWLTAGLFHLVVDEDVEMLRPVRQLLAGGDVLSPARVRRALATLPDLVLVNGYGPTEGTTFATTHAMRTPDEVDDPVPIGRPIANSEAWVLDARGEPTPLGVPGELHIGGAGLARGYVGNPAWTAERFVPHPFADSPGARLYRTGDRARVRPDGTIEFLGRLDRQVKLRGYRIEPGEVEAALRAEPSVREAVVEVRAGRAGEKQLVAWVVPEGEGRFDPVALRDVLRGRLPAYMQPGAWQILDALPLTANGKLDRAALPDPGAAAAAGATAAGDASLQGGAGALRTPAEVELARIWREVLRLDQVAPDDDFFALGGDSILGIQVLSRARAAGYALEPVQLFSSPTLRALAAAAAPIEDGEAAGEFGSDPAGAALESAAGAVALTPVHHWFFDQELPVPDHWNMALRLTLAAPLEAARLARALAIVVARHDALRLRATRPEGGWQLEVVAAGEAVPLDVVRAPDDAAARERMIQESTAALHAGLDLAQGPIVRAALFEDGRGESFELVLVIHHLAVDAVSWGIVLGDLERACHAPDSGLATPGRPAVTFRHWAGRLEALVADGALGAELPAWIRRVATPPTRLPRDRPGAGRGREATLDTVWARLDAATSDLLRREARRAYRAEALDLLLAALADTLARWPGASVGRVDVERHGREPLFEDLDPSRTVGWFTAIVPVDLAAVTGAEPPEA
ncbi:MAG: amino acid adenylation domain-containing protein, partial [Candidatus Eisenbacteria bacterium]